MLSTKIDTPAPAPIPPAIKCGGCFQPVDPATSTKRTIHPTASRYSRFSRGSKPEAPRVEHFCDWKCQNKAELDARGGFRF